MAQLRGRHEVARRKQRLAALMTKIDGSGLEAELIAHYSRYLCVLVSGFVEQSVKELVAQYCRDRANTEIQQYVGRQMGLLRNIDFEKLKQLVESFNVDWWRELQALRADELEAFGSVAAVRNNVSHGGDAGMTMGTVRQYFQQISAVLDDLCGYFDPG
jgi:uncharacterized protein YpuA (DUF1002 family)